MKIRKNIGAIGMALVALTSCSSMEQNKPKSEKINLTYLMTNDSFSKRIDDEISNPSNNKNTLSYYNKDNFKLTGLTYMYEGEEIALNTNVGAGVKVTKITAKNPVIVVGEKDPRYSKYKNNIDGKIKVEVDEATKTKTITFLDVKTVYVTLKNKNGESREIMLEHPVKVIDKPASIQDGTRYVDVKKGKDNQRIRYQVLTNDGGYEDEAVTEVDRWYKYSEPNKYEDLDDLVGTKYVKIKDNFGNIYTREVNFGTKITDFKDDYSKILTDLDKTTLKFSEDGLSVTGGFNPDLVKKLTKYEEVESNGKSKLEFVTEILDKDKNVGRHKVRRKIVRDGVVIYSKVEDAYVGFSGTTVAVADSSFYSLTPEVEARVIRFKPKGTNYATEQEKEDDDTLNKNRPHGEDVISSMIDEIALGESNLWIPNLFGMDRELRGLISKGLNREVSGLTEDEQIVAKIKEKFWKTSLWFKFSNEPIYIDKGIALTNKLREFTKLKEEIKDLTEEEQKAKLKKYYEELYEKYEDVIAITEKEKLKYTDLHFKVIAIGTPTDGLDTSSVSKYLNEILEEDKNVKAINMSYGSELDISDYYKIKNMTKEEKLKAVDEYNNNPHFRTAVLEWLNNYDDNDKYFKEQAPGNLSVGSMRKFFMDKGKIDINDYQMLLDIRMVTLKHNLGKGSELNSSNKDILFVRAQGNTYGNGHGIKANLTDFDENGKKIIYNDGNKKYNESFTSIPIFLNELEKEKAKKEGREYKYNYSYRKNMLGVVGLTNKYYGLGYNATENISNMWAILTMDNTPYHVLLSSYAEDYYSKLTAELEKISKNPEKYSEEYRNEILGQLSSYEARRSLDTDLNGKPLYMSFTRAGVDKLWTVAVEGQIDYVLELDENSSKYVDSSKFDMTKPFNFKKRIRKFNIGSSFAAPRITAIAGEVGTKYPWMTANQIKQTILTTATDDMRFVNDDDGKIKALGIYGPDENIGWGISNKHKAYNGPARFVKALTLEEGKDYFDAAIPYGTYTFANDIEGALKKEDYMFSRQKLTFNELLGLEFTKGLSREELLASDFETNEKTKSIAENLKKINVTTTDILETIPKKIDKYINELPEDEKALFESAGLVKSGNGTLILAGENTYTADTDVKGGTLIITGSSKSNINVSKDSKLKLDMALLEIDKRRSDKKSDENFASKLDARIKNEGELYSYSKSDRVKEYAPINYAKTYIAAIANLQIDKLDLSNTGEFDINIFRKKGMNVFEMPEEYTSSDFRIEGGTQLVEEISNKKINEKEILNIKSVSKMDADKIKEGTTNYTRNIDLIVTKTENEDGSYNVVAKLVRTEDKNADTAYSRVRLSLINKMKNSSSEERQALNTDLNDLDWTDPKEFDGKALVNSQLLGYNLLEKKNIILSDRLDENETKDKLSFFVDAINDNKVKLGEDDKNIFTNGTMVGLKYKTKYNTSGVSINYTNSILKEYDLVLEDIKTPIDYTLSAEKQKELEEKKKVKKLVGNVYGNNVGLSVFNNFRYNNGFLKSILSLDYLMHSTTRNIDDREVKNLDSSDFIANLKLEGGYDFNIKDRVTISPYVGTTLISYTKGEFKENTEYGYEGASQSFFKVNATLGTKVNVKIVKGLNLGLDLSYTKYLTPTQLETEVELPKYAFKDKIKGVSLEDHIVNYGVNLNYNFGKVTLNAGYKGRNLSNHGVNIGMKVEW